jgi:ribosomal protein S18 acetylase RimI-like enzyme
LIQYKTLDTTSREILHESFIEAFSDYQVKMDLPFWKFMQMLQRRGYNPAVSIGAFRDNKLVGFSLNGIRIWNDKETVYDIATGVVPEYRRQGITSAVFSYVKKFLEDKQIKQYLLEVIKSNHPAVQLYQKEGFEILREFSCFFLQKEKFVKKEICRVERTDKIDFEQVKHFWDYSPSWQNSPASINAAPETFIYYLVRQNNAVAGYGIVEERTGDIPQIAVDKKYRSSGIASSIISEMVRTVDAEKFNILNVDIRSESVERFLIRMGFEHYINQYEMLLKI